MMNKSISTILLNAIGDIAEKSRLSDVVLHFKEYAQEFQSAIEDVSEDDRCILEEEYPEIFTALAI
jgi:hypothetical protein